MSRLRRWRQQRALRVLFPHHDWGGRELLISGVSVDLKRLAEADDPAFIAWLVAQTVKDQVRAAVYDKLVDLPTWRLGNDEQA